MAAPYVILFLLSSFYFQRTLCYIILHKEGNCSLLKVLFELVSSRLIRRLCLPTDVPTPRPICPCLAPATSRPFATVLVLRSAADDPSGQ